MLTTILPLTVAALIAAPQPAAAQPTLTKVDQAAGWKLYTGPDAKSLWRAYKQPAFPAKGWALSEGVLSTAGAGGGDLMTTEQFGDFELTCRFKMAPKANSGIIWRCTEQHDASWQTGPEYQVLEDATYGAKSTDAHSCAALYDLFSPSEGKTMMPAGQWNEGRIYLRNGVVQHWLNGQQVVEAVIADDAGKPTQEWLEKIAASKFKEYPGFGVQPRGHIALQEHDGEISYTDVRIRDLGAPLPGEMKLYNGKDLTGWVAIVPEAAKAGMKPEDVWSVKDGILICKGNPIGYIRTEKDYRNFVLKVEWRFNPVTRQAGNSGVLLRMVGADKVWPKSVEAQLESGNAGDFWNIDEVRMTADRSRTSGRNTKKTHGAERPIGEWNEYEIIVNHGQIILKVNGEELNRATDVEEVAGKICLQSEGAEIQFRSVRLAPLE
jgi:hypothetical protein